MLWAHFAVSATGGLRSINCWGRASRCSEPAKLFAEVSRRLAPTMEGTIEAAHKGRGRYAVGSRWHEAMLIEMLRALGSPSLEWRYGDG